MATVNVKERDLQVRFAMAERPFTRRAGLTIPLAAIRKVEALDQPLAHTRGGRAGLLVSGVLKIGTWGFGSDARQLVSVRRGVPALRVLIDRTATDGRVDELLISVKNAAELAREINNRAGGPR